MLARYDLDHELPTFDFFGWGVMAIRAGATELVIDDRNGDSERQRRLESIILPGAELFGVPVHRGQDGCRFTYGGFDHWKLKNLIDWTKAGNGFARLKSIRPPIATKYTVTLRNSSKSPHRNSDADLWRRFARDIGAVVIEDYFDKPIDLHERIALYAGAEMNFGVWSGPMFLITLTGYPCCCSNWGIDEPAKIMKWGIARNEAIPWLLPNQSTLWKRADELVKQWKRIYG